MPNTIEVEATTQPADPPAANQTQALTVRQQGGAVGRALTVDELSEKLKFIRRVMKEVMKEDQDYGKIPGTGDKPSLFQPGAQKLLLTFNLREQVKREVLRELPHPSVMGHREYEFTVTVFPAGDRPENGWDGVGTCSTLESKYRYRKAERKCPQCHKAHIIVGKEEYGGGFLCWKKKGGCGAKFDANDQRILSQPAEDVENEDPADYWNTVRKMAFKRALIHASINGTNTSDLWTQDVEDMAANAAAKTPGEPAGAPAASAPRGSAPARPATNRPTNKAPAKPATAAPATKATFPPADANTRARMIRELTSCIDLATEYFQKLANPAVLLPNETLEDVPLWAVPISRHQMDSLKAAIADFGNGGDAVHAFAPNPEAPAKDKAPKPTGKPGEKRPPPVVEKAKEDPEWWRKVICPIPPRGMKRDDYMKQPETVGSMYDNRHDEATAKRLFGFMGHFEVKSTFQGQDGKERQRSESQIQADQVFRDALDACAEYHEKHKDDTAPESEPAAEEPAAAEDEPTPWD